MSLLLVSASQIKSLQQCATWWWRHLLRLESYEGVESEVQSMNNLEQNTLKPKGWCLFSRLKVKIPDVDYKVEFVLYTKVTSDSFL